MLNSRSRPGAATWSRWRDQRDEPVAYAFESRSSELSALRIEAEHGDAGSQYRLGCQYLLDGEDAEAATWFRRAAGQGLVGAQLDLGIMYYYGGRNVPQDKTEAAKWFRRAADQGHDEAQAKLGLMYYYGRGVREDEAEAARWFHQAADRGDARVTEGNRILTEPDHELVEVVAEAQELLGDMHRAAGTVVLQDYVAAYRWYIRAAAQGLSNALENAKDLANRMPGWQLEEAQESLGDMAALWLLYHSGEGDQVWYEARTQELPDEEDILDTQEETGSLLGDSDQPACAYVAAHAWMNVAAALGHADAAGRRDALSELMTIDQIAEAQSDARSLWDRLAATASRPLA